MARFTGGCLCRAVRYSVDLEPARTLVCHCTTCQRQTGSAFATLMAFPAGSVDVTGTLKTYTEPGGMSGDPVHRRFCPECGTTVIFQREGAPMTLIMAGTLDDTSGIRPTANIFCASAQKWVVMPANTQNLPGYFT
ncbi:MAG: GFA family protein [Acetobacteraceae bacterium]|jgi:hypothetical protein